MKLFEVRTQRGMDWFDIAKVLGGVMAGVAGILALVCALHGFHG